MAVGLFVVVVNIGVIFSRIVRALGNLYIGSVAYGSPLQIARLPMPFFILSV